MESFIKNSVKTSQTKNLKKSLFLTESTNWPLKPAKSCEKSRSATPLGPAPKHARVTQLCPASRASTSKTSVSNANWPFHHRANRGAVAGKTTKSSPKSWRSAIATPVCRVTSTRSSRNCESSRTPTSCRCSAAATPRPN